MGQRWGRTRGMGGVWLMWVESKGVEPKRGGVKKGRSQKEAESKLGGAKRRRSQKEAESKWGGVKNGWSQKEAGSKGVEPNGGGAKRGWSPSFEFFFFQFIIFVFCNSCE